MKDRTIAQTATLTAALILGSLVEPLRAQVSFYNDPVTFQTASSTTVAVTFEDFTPTYTDISTPITLGGITFTALNPPRLLVATPAKATQFSVRPESNVLTVSGNEDIDMVFSTAPTAIGFETYTNPFNPPIVSVYDVHGNLLATHTLSQAPSTKGFVGITSSIPIGRVNWLADRGDVVDTGIDNVRVGTVRPHSLTFYLHGHDIPETAGGFTMNQTPGSAETLAVNLGFNATAWFSEPALTGTFLPGAIFKLAAPRTVGLNLAIAYRLEATNPDGSNAQLLGQTTQTPQLGSGPQTIAIPVSTPVALNNQRLKLTISSAVGVNVNLQMDSNSIEGTNFVGTP